MIRLADISDAKNIAIMLMAMYSELFGVEASTNISDYYKDIINTLLDDKKFLYVEDNHKGFFIVDNMYSALLPNRNVFHGSRVYIVPKYRKTKLLYEFYNKLFEDFPYGDILGFTELNSEHIEVLNKRHVHIMNVYKLNRSI